MRIGTILVALVTFCAGSAASQLREVSPQEVAERYVDAMRDGDFTGMAGLMHPSALREMRGLLEALLESPDADAVRQQLLGVPSRAEARALSDTTLFAAFMRNALQQDPATLNAVGSARVKFIGRVDEGPDTTHVVYRMAMTVEGIPMTQMDVMSLARSPDGWRGLLKGEVAGLAAAIRAALEQRP